MRKFCFILCFFIFGPVSFSQSANSGSNNTNASEKVNNTIHSDISTIAFVGFWSINYEKTFKQNPGKNSLRFRTGFIYSYDSYSYGIPLCLTSLFGKSNRHYFEIAVGIVPRTTGSEGKDGFGIGGYLEYKYSIYPLIDIGYRFEPGPGKLFYRIKVGYTGLGIGVGYAF